MELSTEDQLGVALPGIEECDFSEFLNGWGSSDGFDLAQAEFDTSVHEGSMQGGHQQPFYLDQHALVQIMAKSDHSANAGLAVVAPANNALHTGVAAAGETGVSLEVEGTLPVGTGVGLVEEEHLSVDSGDTNVQGLAPEATIAASAYTADNAPSAPAPQASWIVETCTVCPHADMYRQDEAAVKARADKTKVTQANKAYRSRQLKKDKVLGKKVSLAPRPRLRGTDRAQHLAMYLDAIKFMYTNGSVEERKKVLAHQREMYELSSSTQGSNGHVDMRLTATVARSISETALEALGVDVHSAE